MKRQFIAIFVITALVVTGCAGQAGTRDGNNTVRPQNTGESVQMLEDGQITLPIVKIDGTDYVDIAQMAEVIGFQFSNWSDDKTNFGIGDNDIVWSFKPESRTAEKEETEVLMDAPARKHQGTIMIPSSALKPLFGEEAVFTVQEGQVFIFPASSDTPAGDPEEDFGDDPEDLTQGKDLEASVSLPMDLQAQLQDMSVLSLNQRSQLITKAKRYLGVPYKFGAGPYTRTKRFDCSSYVRHLYADFGYKLPRTARAQATKGKLVPKSKLRRGDLLFFYVPGRFKTNTKVGHVGIYMGNKKMIHSSPKPKNGVQISNINSNYWKRTFLRAKRLS
ncbi:C40 family peptidase [Paenibacillus tarimensis]